LFHEAEELGSKMIWGASSLICTSSSSAGIMDAVLQSTYARVEFRDQGSGAA
jgi:hypothetical protein